MSLKQQTIDYTGLSTPIEQTYTYDALNRLKSSTEKYNNGATESWKQTFNYDRYGNRVFDAANTTTLAGGSNKFTNPVIETSSNRIKENQDGGPIDYD